MSAAAEVETQPRAVRRALRIPVVSTARAVALPPVPVAHCLLPYGTATLLGLAPKWTAAGGQPLTVAPGLLQGETEALVARMAGS